jgi:hypothetical protein
MSKRRQCKSKYCAMHWCTPGTSVWFNCFERDDPVLVTLKGGGGGSRKP